MEEEKLTWKEKVKDFCKEHKDVLLTGATILASIGCGVMKIVANKREYEDNLFTEVDGEIYKIPAKQMKTAKNLTK